jgi:hypothetical protein
LVFQSPPDRKKVPGDESQLHENPLLADLFANSSEIPQIVRLDGWRCSDVQPNLHRNSLLTGNFTGNFANLALERLDQIRKAPVLQAFLEQFPAKAYQGK